MFIRSKIQIIMMRKRSRSVGNKNNRQSISTETNSNTSSVSSPSSNPNKPNSPSFFSYSRLFFGLSPKTSSTINGQETEHFSMSPTSTLEPKPFTKLTNHWFHSHVSHSTINETKPKTPTKPIGLGLIDALKEEEDSNSKTSISKLKIQLPPFNEAYNFISPTSHHLEFGVKNKSSQLALCSPIDKSPIGSNGCLSPRDLELLSEDYTCIISHGPNAKTTHIFDNKVVENPSTGLGFTVPVRCDSDRISSGGDLSRHESDDFLSFCHACNKDLDHGSDIFMYRGERAFCSKECRYQEMSFDEMMD